MRSISWLEVTGNPTIKDMFWHSSRVLRNINSFMEGAVMLSMFDSAYVDQHTRLHSELPVISAAEGGGEL